MKKKIAYVANQIRWTILGIVGAGAVMSLALNMTAESKDNPSKKSVNVVIDNRPLERNAQSLTSFAPVVDQVSNSVVNVFTTKKGEKLGGRPNLPPQLQPFFAPPGHSGRSFQSPDQHGLGSGVIVSEDGYILTNNHVVESADEIRVALNPDGREFKAEIVGKDPKSDVAILKIEASNLPALKMTDSDQIRVGDLVLAIGNPFGIGQTVTMGMISAKGRGSLGLDYEEFIQTDAAINPGNSGGALVDMEGRLIGINTAILSRSGGNQGIGFAIPVNLARMVMESLIENGYVDRGFLGVMIQDLTPDLAKGFQVPVNRGALVADVTQGSAADEAGIKEGDVIVEFNGHPIRDSRQLKARVGHTPPGTDVTVHLYRNGKQEKMDLALQSLTDENQLAVGPAQESKEFSQGILNGVRFDDLDRTTRVQWGIPGQVQGILVSDVAPDSPAFDAGLRPGQVVQAINREPVGHTRDLKQLNHEPNAEVTLLKVWTERGPRYVVVDESNLG